MYQHGVPWDVLEVLISFDYILIGNVQNEIDLEQNCTRIFCLFYVHAYFINLFFSDWNRKGHLDQVKFPEALLIFSIKNTASNTVAVLGLLLDGACSSL